MTTELKRGLDEHYMRSQWVIAGPVESCAPDNMAYYIRYLWESDAVVVDGFKDDQSLASAMGNAIRARLRTLHDALVAGFATKQSFEFMDSGISVEIDRDTQSGHVMSCVIKCDGKPDIAVDVSDYPEITSLLCDRAEDAMMEMAAYSADEAYKAKSRLSLAVAGTLAWAFPNVHATIHRQTVAVIIDTIPSSEQLGIARVLEQMRDLQHTANELEEPDDKPTNTEG